jgi:chromosome partitioning protein
MTQIQAAPDSRVVTRGYLEEFGIVAVLQALSLSRQYTAVELYTEDGKVAGRVTLKSGMVLEASIPGNELEGAAAFSELVARRLHAFQVERLPPPAHYPLPIGRLATQLLAAHANDAAPQRGQTASQTPVVAARIPTNPLPGPGSEERIAPVSARYPAPISAPFPGTFPASRPGPVSVPRPAAPLKVATAGSVSPSPLTSTCQVPILGIASPKGGCGKTTVALNLAVSLARGGSKVVLVDADPNGDVLSAIGSRERASVGVFDVLSGAASASNLELRTAIDGLRLIPAMGPNVVRSLSHEPEPASWRSLFESVLRGADVVVVDTPAGMFGTTARILSACTHVLGVLQAEAIPKRSFSMFQQGLASMDRAPEVAGVVLNMFRRSHSASVSVLVDVGMELPEAWLFDTTIPRNDAFLDASEQGMPLVLAEGDSAAFIASLFDTLATQLKDRLGLGKPQKPPRPKSFLL